MRVPDSNSEEMNSQPEQIFDDLAKSDGAVDKTIKKSKNHGGRTTQGKEEKLGGFVFGYGHKHQAEYYNRTIEEIADFVGTKYSKEMRLLVKKGKEFAPDPPDKPKVGTDI